MSRSALACALLVSAACVRVEAYSCSHDEECLTSADGTCEPTGYCSYPDRECASRRRYGPLAGPLAELCTEVEIGTTEDPSVDPTTTTHDSNASTSSREDVPERVTATETGATEEHGTVVWSFTRVGDAHAADVFASVEPVGVGEDFIVAGHETLKAGGRNGIMLRYAGPETSVWSRSWDPEGGEDHVAAMVEGSGGELYLAGQMTVDDNERGWFAQYHKSGNEDWTLEVPAGPASDVARGGIEIVAVGNDGWMTPFAIATYGQKDAAWIHALEARSEWRLLSTAAHDVTVFVGGFLGTAAYLGRVDSKGVHQLAAWVPPRATLAAIQRLAASKTEAAIFAVGYLGTLGKVRQGWIARLDLTGNVTWEADLGDSYDDEFESVVVTESDQIYVAGFYGSPEDADLWVAAWTPDGEKRWEETYPDLDHGDGIARDIAVMPGGDLLVVGEVDGPTGDRDAIVVRITP